MGGSQRESGRKDKSEGVRRRGKREKSLDVQSLLGQGCWIGLDHWGFFGKANISAHAPAEMLQCDFSPYIVCRHTLTYSQNHICALMRISTIYTVPTHIYADNHTHIHSVRRSHGFPLNSRILRGCLCVCVCVCVCVWVGGVGWGPNWALN